MKLEILDKLTLPAYMKYWNMENGEEILDENGDLYPDHIALGIREGQKPVAVIAAELSGERAEVKLLQFLSAEAVDLLMDIFLQHIRTLGYTGLTYHLTASQTEAELLRRSMQKNGWPMPSAQIRCYQLECGKIAFTAKATKGDMKGNVCPFFDTTERQRISLAMELPEDSPFFQMEHLLPEYCAAYVVEGRIDGYFLCTEQDGGLCLELMQFPEEETAKGALILAAAELFEKSKEPWVYVMVRTEFGEQVVKRFFEKQIMDVQVILMNEEE